MELDRQRYALELSSVERVVRNVSITPLPSAPAGVLGIIDVAGEVVVVLDIRQRFGLPTREASASDSLVLARAGQRRLALLVDAIAGIEASDPESWVDPTKLLPNAPYVAGVLKRTDGLVLIHDLETFLSAGEALSLDAALQERGAA